MGSHAGSVGLSSDSIAAVSYTHLDVYKRQVFAQLERETIQKRVTDAYYSRCLKGFHMSGQAPYGYQLEPTVVEGIRTKKMVADPVAADHVRLMFEMYAEPETSFGRCV